MKVCINCGCVFFKFFPLILTFKHIHTDSSTHYSAACFPHRPYFLDDFLGQFFFFKLYLLNDYYCNEISDLVFVILDFLSSTVFFLEFYY